MQNTRLTKAVESGDYSAIQLLEIAATETPSGPLRDLLLRAAAEISRNQKEIEALEVASEPK